MSESSFSKRVLALLCALALFGAATGPIHASMLGTGSLIEAERSAVDRERLLAQLEREEVREQLQALGVHPKAAAERIVRMTDAEIRMFSERLEELPAGAGLLEVALFIVLLLVITDALGITDIFPFVHSQ
ncbi:MAG: PA2779 family protein [Thioalkalivibrio sp.]|nr:PA2779 family protein [Thioalkalivibrio sp.]